MLGRIAPVARITGEPASSNGASSFHLWWDLPYGELLSEVSATLEIIEPPTVDRLYFWALQASFVKPGGGGAHLGLQHHPRFPGQTAANWGGYRQPGSGAHLEGTVSPLPSALGNPNTRDFPWIPHRPYRLTIGRSPDLGPAGLFSWRGTIEDLHTGDVTVVRDLFSRGEYLRGPVVWTESFARCDHPPVAVRWSDLLAVGEADQPIDVGLQRGQRRVFHPVLPFELLDHELGIEAQLDAVESKLRGAQKLYQSRYSRKAYEAKMRRLLEFLS